MSDNTFEAAIKQIQYSSMDFHSALIDVNDTIEFSKKILLNNRVQNFTAADVVKVAELVIERSDVLRNRRMKDDADAMRDNDGDGFDFDN